MIKRKIFTGVFIASGLIVSGCVGDIANTIAGTNGATLSATPSSVQLVALTTQNESSSVITIRNNNPIDGAATNIVPSFSDGNSFTIVNNTCGGSLGQGATCQITVGGSGNLQVNDVLIIGYNAGNSRTSISVPVSYFPYSGDYDTPQSQVYSFYGVSYEKK